MVGAPAHPGALDNVEVLGVDQWLALLIIGDLDPRTQPLTSAGPIPIGLAKSPIRPALLRRECGDENA
ncbi:hypothetical protein GCM10025875_31850 [Litorihabitans aurantiacus]|uniref:Uncharacterized protein n=1 Tax=Litorihabitans aurantiacus TaxID=1930061 RepID=A0AA37XGG1_9MICO|nr:hypothetical protein GCM10025875_31850 [Litorihabitans aurantiacus]